MLAFAIMAEVDGDGPGWLTARLAAEGHRLDEAAIEIVASERFGSRPWHAVSSPCPWLGPLAGYVVVTPPAGLPVPPDLARALMRVGRGVVARLDDDRAIAAVALATVPVEEAVAAGGLDAGARLLERDPAGAYAADVMARIKDAVAGGGLRIGLTWQHADATRNPIELQRVQPFGSDQAYPPVWGKGGASFDRIRPLRALLVALWLLDLAALDDASFWSPAP